MTPNLPWRRTGQRGLRLWTAVALSFCAALAVASTVFITGWELLGVQGLKPEHKLTSNTLFDLVKLSFGVVAGAGALVALVVAYRRQRVDEDGARRENTRLHTERFTTAVSQLGQESSAVRLGGVYALAGLADDAPTRELRQTCIDVLCAYLRMPYTAEADLPPGDANAQHAFLALREVRHTIIRIIGHHLSLPREHPHSWQGHDLDFTGVIFDGGDFTKAVFSGGRVAFNRAQFTGGKVDFTEAQFTSGEVDFTEAQFTSGEVNFFEPQFTGGKVVFLETQFTGGEVRFVGGQFTSGEVLFLGAQFTSGKLLFFGPEFTGSEVEFVGAQFNGGRVDFSDVAGAAPDGLVPAAGEPLLAGLILPSEWYQPTP
ncbi:pentapeptide repeat-containing protein [Actinacidiphila glaucinigra]|uniref:pentapeptide repeat-containing protein n=1 Tax=Actinacidiphila glaucinigra TaxID=235986 RepID=UPI003D8C3F30